MTRRHDPRRARPHISYSTRELCRLFNVAEGTVRRWTRKGLTPIDRQIPYLFAGGAVQAFLQAYNKPRQPTNAGELFCVACKHVVTPAGDIVHFVPLSPSNGNLVGRCPRCSRVVCQRVRKSEIARKAGHLLVLFEDGEAYIAANSEPAHSAQLEELGS